MNGLQRDAAAATAAPLVRVSDLRMYFPGPRAGFWPWQGWLTVKAVDGVSFAIAPGETLGLVGESGCGKSTIARSVLQLYRPTAGEVFFEGRDLCRLSAAELRPMRQRAQIIFQDPYASLDPRRTIGYTVAEPLLLAGLTDAGRRRERVQQLLRLVGLDPSYENRYPHEFSGGQRQRVGIARALATEPSFIVADEPISALDVSIQAQVINLLVDLRNRLNLTLLFISHDLRVVRFISHQIAVMYLGRVVETAPAEDLFRSPGHPYTLALLSAVPRARWEDTGTQPIKLEGEVPSPINPPPGCAFAPRCPLATEICRTVTPTLSPLASRHDVACHHTAQVQSLRGADAGC